MSTVPLSPIASPIGLVNAEMSEENVTSWCSVAGSIGVSPTVTGTPLAISDLICDESSPGVKGLARIPSGLARTALLKLVCIVESCSVVVAYIFSPTPGALASAFAPQMTVPQYGSCEFSMTPARVTPLAGAVPDDDDVPPPDD